MSLNGNDGLSWRSWWPSVD